MTLNTTLSAIIYRACSSTQYQSTYQFEMLSFTRSNGMIGTQKLYNGSRDSDD